MNEIKLGVNIDHVATIRQARRTRYPEPVAAAVLAELGGADIITVHLREDRRHIQDRDVRILRQTISTRLNLEMACWDEIIAIALEIRPDQVTLVPERREELTTEGGLDVKGQLSRIAQVIGCFRKAGIRVSLFVNPEDGQLRASKDAGADCVELHTGEYANATSDEATLAQLAVLRRAATAAAALGLGVNAGHGLHYHNVRSIVAIPEIAELHIGHSIVAHAVMVGMERAVREMKELLRRPHG